MGNVYFIKKFTSPVLAPIILHREGLVTRLHEMIAGPAAGFPHHKLVLLYAPAGYGKTTLLADFARNASMPCCWYQLDHTDADKITFLQRLIASIRQCFPQFGAVLDSLIASAIAIEDTQSHRAVVDALIAAIEAENTEHFALFLCNYQEVNECQEINELVNYLLRELPTKCVLVIESRATPDLEFALLLAHREMVGMGSYQLRFSAQEIRDLARLQGTGLLQEAEAERLVDTFEGWITGILLSSHLGEMQILQQQQTVPRQASNRGSHTDQQLLFSYMISEVFQRNTEIYHFLQEASVLREMTPALCAQLFDMTDAAERLQYLEQNGLFVTHKDDGDQVIYTCHPALRELLYNDLRSQKPERFSALHRRVAELLQGSDNYEEAIYHALEAKADEIAARLILDAYEKMINQGQMQTLARWIDELPDPVLARHPRLLLSRTHIHLLVGEHIKAFALLDHVSKVIKCPTESIDIDEMPLLQIESDVLRSKALFQQAEYHQVVALCQQILEHLPADEVKFRAEVHTRLGVCANLQGNYTVGISHLQKALQLWGRHITNRQTAEVHGALASTYSLIGNFALAEHHIARSITCWEQLHDEWGKTNNLIRLGLIKQRQGALSEAEDFFIQALTLARSPINFLRGQAYALVNMGVLYQDLKTYEKSLVVIEDGLALTRQLKDKYLMNYALCMLAMTYLYMGDASTALLLVSEVEVRDSSHNETPGYEHIMRELSRGTIFVYQGRYDEAYTCLCNVEPPLQAMGLKREWLQATLRLAACFYGLQRVAEAVNLMEKIMAQLKVQSGYEHLVLIELHRLRTLYQAIEALPEMAGVREQLSLAAESQEAPQSFEQPQGQPSPSAPDAAASSSIQITASPFKIAIQAFGEPLVTLQDRPVTRWRMARSMELFFFLLDCGRPMRKEQIITTLWTEVDEQINQTFHSTVYYLRKALGVPCVVSQGSIYALNLDSHYGDNISYDVAAFQQQQARAKLALAQENEEALSAALSAMVELYRGDYVQSFYSDWCSFRRDELRHAYLEARRQLARIAWNNEQFDESVVHWQHMLAIDDCLEDVHYGLMRCYAKQGKRGLALRQYQRCRDTLQQELAVAPGTAIQNLYQRLMSTT